VSQADTAVTSLQTTGSQLGSALTTVQARQSFTTAMINTLQTGSDNLVLADINQEGANMLALQTRQQLSTTALSLANQANQPCCGCSAKPFSYFRPDGGASAPPFSFGPPPAAYEITLTAVRLCSFLRPHLRFVRHFRGVLQQRTFLIHCDQRRECGYGSPAPPRSVTAAYVLVDAVSNAYGELFAVLRPLRASLVAACVLISAVSDESAAFFALLHPPVRVSQRTS